jgi:hypothetical protein
MACALVTLMAFNRGGDGFNHPPVVKMILASPDSAAYASAGAQTAQNHLASVTFDWTNRSVFNSSMGFTPTTNLNN